MKKLLYSFALVLFAGGAVWAQHFCATDYYHRQLVEQDPNLAKDLDRLLANARTKSDDSTVFVVPVVFHVLHQNGSENISDAQIFDAMEVLNRDFRKQNGDTASVFPMYQRLIADSKIEFKLAAYDPLGNCTNGIDRIYTHESRFEINDPAGKLNQWDRSRYLNIWVVASIIDAPSTGGFAHFPTDVGGYRYWMDGIVLRHNLIGRIGTGNEYNSRTLTHEVGHWIALPHTWGRTNDPGVACGDDGSDDTPMTKGHTSCANKVSFSCENISFNGAYDFRGVTTSSGSIDTTATPDQIVLGDTRVKLSSFEAVGVSANSVRDSVFAFNDWDTGALDGETDYNNLTGSINLAKYYEFTVDPQDLQGMNLTEMTFRVGRNGTGIRTFAVRSSANNYASNLAVTISPPTPQLSTKTGGVLFLNNDIEIAVNNPKIVLGGGLFSNLYGPVTFRIYGYNAEDATGTFEVDNVRVVGKFGTIENVENYMEYAFCSKMFTPDQVSIMRNTLQGSDSQRKNLITPETHEFTGVDLTSPPVCIPIVDIKANRMHACVGQSITFTDQSYNGPVTFREWSFQDGTPATSTASNPSVTFDSYGLKTVTLTVGNASGQVTKTFTQLVDVQPDWAAYTGPKTFDLEQANQYQELRFVNDANTYSQFVPYPVGYESNKSLKLTVYKDISGAMAGTEESRYYQNLGKQVDAIITPTFDLRNMTDVTFSFDYSYATNAVQTSQMTEKIRISYSRDCGNTWIPVGSEAQSTIEKGALATAGLAGNIDFIPTSNSDWGHYSRPYTVSTSFDGRTRFKIEFTASDYSSNLYVDNIMVSGVLGLADNFTSEHELIIAPNPVVSGNDLNIQYVAGSEPVTFTLRNLQGEEITSVVRNEVNQPVSFGFEISDKVAAAYYFLEVKSASSTAVKKIAVIK